MFSKQKKPILNTEHFDFAVGKSSLGAVLVALSEYGVVSALIGRDPKSLVVELQERFPKIYLREGGREAKTALTHVIACIEKPGLKFNLPINMRGTLFQRRVWQAVQKIPLGETSTYSDIALAIRAPRAMRAVGAVARIIISP